MGRRLTARAADELDVEVSAAGLSHSGPPGVDEVGVREGSRHGSFGTMFLFTRDSSGWKAITDKTSRWDAYKDAVLRIEAPGGAIWVRRMPISQTAGKYPDPEGRTIYVITAHNPGGRLAPDAENAAAQARLAAELGRRGLTWWPAAGGNPSLKHVETSAAVIGIQAADAIALGTQFG